MKEGFQPSPEEMAQQDYEAKLSKKREEKDYYRNKSEQLDLEPITRFVEYHPNPSELMKMGITFAHRDLQSVVDAMAEGQPWAVVSGLNPSGPLHFGHKQVFDELLWMQRQGAEIYIPITNDETYVVGKTDTLARSRAIAYQDVIPSIIAMGFNPEKTHIFVDSDYLDIYNVAMDISKHLNLNRICGVFGFGKDEEGENVGTMFYRGAVQLAQILLPQYEEFGGSKPSVIPVGIDQYPYILLSRDVAIKKHLIPPAATFIKFGEGLDGKGKMSVSRQGSALFLTDDHQTARKKIKSSYTGGSILARYQSEHGGIPDICPIYQLRSTHFANDTLHKQCSSGQILCSQCKKEAEDEVMDFLERHKAQL
ncbi:MAG: tryptophan--tRNA ligase, partial [Candidatus Woesebacteria bacterium]